MTKEDKIEVVMGLLRIIVEDIALVSEEDLDDYMRALLDRVADAAEEMMQ